MTNMVYALLSARALDQDRAELGLSPHVEDKARKDMARNREGLDDWLNEPVGKQAVGERALIRELGGAA